MRVCSARQRYFDALRNLIMCQFVLKEEKARNSLETLSESRNSAHNTSCTSILTENDAEENVHVKVPEKCIFANALCAICGNWWILSFCSYTVRSFSDTYTLGLFAKRLLGFYHCISFNEIAKKFTNKTERFGVTFRTVSPHFPPTLTYVCMTMCLSVQIRK